MLTPGESTCSVVPDLFPNHPCRKRCVWGLSRSCIQMTSIMTFVIDATDSSCTGVKNFTGSSLKEMTCIAVAYPLTTNHIAMQSPIFHEHMFEEYQLTLRIECLKG